MSMKNKVTTRQRTGVLQEPTDNNKAVRNEMPENEIVHQVATDGLNASAAQNF